MPGLQAAESHPATSQLVVAHRFWSVAGEPNAVVAWIEAHSPAGAKISEHGEINGPGGVTKWFGAFSFPVHTERILSSEELSFEAIRAKGGATTLRADAQVVWLAPRPASAHIPAGISAISVHASSRFPSPVSISTTITEPATVQRTIALIEGLKPPSGGGGSCPIWLPMIELSFLKSGSTASVAKVIAESEGCGYVQLWIDGRLQGRFYGAGSVRELIEELSGTEL